MGLGPGEDAESISSPRRVRSIAADADAIAIACGHDHTVLLTKPGEVRVEWSRGVAVCCWFQAVRVGLATNCSIAPITDFSLWELQLHVTASSPTRCGQRGATTQGSWGTLLTLRDRARSSLCAARGPVGHWLFTSRSAQSSIVAKRAIPCGASLIRIRRTQ